VAPGFRVAGQIVLSDGKAVSTDIEVLLSREEAWDSMRVKPDADGRFEFSSVPAESGNLSTRVPGYRISGRNAGLDPLNPLHLIGTIRTDKTDLVLLFEPGKDLASDRSGSQIELRKEPLRGAEAARPEAGQLHVSGRVLDAENGKPLATFTVTPGRKHEFFSQ